MALASNRNVEDVFRLGCLIVASALLAIFFVLLVLAIVLDPSSGG